MAKSWSTQTNGRKIHAARNKCRRARGVAIPATIEPLDRRVMMAVTAAFNATTGMLTVTGDELDNRIAVSFDATGSVVVNSESGLTTVPGATAAHLKLIQIFALGGNDFLQWAGSANLPAARVEGGAG